jgi:hypothetical protein
MRMSNCALTTSAVPSVRSKAIKFMLAAGVVARRMKLPVGPPGVTVAGVVFVRKAAFTAA